MAATSDSLLFKFRNKDTQSGVTRETVKAIASKLDMSETSVIHVALSKLAEQTLPAYEADDGPPSAREMTAIRKAATASLPKGKLITRQKLF